MAVPAPDKLNLCEKCFATALPGAEFCPECGAPLAKGPGAEGSDLAIYPELARANLLRMRGDYTGAQDVCLALLHRYPNNATANTLLGDIAAEQGDLDHAAEWYELALDLIPGSPAESQKLKAVRQRISEREAASAITQLELPRAQPKTTLYVVIAVCAIFLAGAFAFAIGRKSGETQALGSDSPYRLPKRAYEPVVEPDLTPNPGPAVLPSSFRTLEDIALTEAIAAKSSDGALLLDASEDPRTHGVRLTFSAEGSDAPRLLAAKLADAAFSHSGDIQRLFIRAVRDKKLFFCASSTRDAWLATQEAAWRETNKSDLKALADAVLADEWTAPGGGG